MTNEQQTPFQEFWNTYPRKKGGLIASEKSYKKALKSVTHEELIERTTAYAKSVEGKDKDFIPYPATWLNQGRWTDDIEEKSSRNGFDPLEALKELDNDVSH